MIKDPGESDIKTLTPKRKVLQDCGLFGELIKSQWDQAFTNRIRLKKRNPLNGRASTKLRLPNSTEAHRTLLILLTDIHKWWLFCRQEN